MRPEDEAEYRDYVAGRAAAFRRTAYLLCGDWHRAEDLVQHALTSLYTHWHRVRARDNLDAYVRAALVRRAIDESRRPWRREHATALLPDVVELDSFAIEDREEVRAALRRLPARQRAVVVLRFYDDVDVAGTARLMNCSEGTVKSYTARALATLRAVLVPVTQEEGRP